MENGNNNNLLLFGNYEKHFEVLEGEQAKELLLLLFAFARGEELESKDILVNTMFSFMKDNIIVGTKRRIASIENGRKGGKTPKKKKVETIEDEIREITTVEETKPQKNKLPQKTYGEYKRVKLDDKQYQKVLETYNNDVNIVNEAIQMLDDWFESIGKSKGSNHSIQLTSTGKQGWVRNNMEEKYKNKSLKDIPIELTQEFMNDFYEVN